MEKEEFISAFLKDEERASRSRRGTGKRRSSANALWSNISSIQKQYSDLWHSEEYITIAQAILDSDISAETKAKKIWALCLYEQYLKRADEPDEGLTSLHRLARRDVNEVHESEEWGVLSSKERKLFIKDKKLFEDTFEKYLIESASRFNEPSLLPSVNLELKQNRFIGCLYAYRLNQRLELMKLIVERPLTASRRSELNKLEKNYIYIASSSSNLETDESEQKEMQYRMQINDYKTVGAANFKPYWRVLKPLERDLYLDLYSTVSASDAQYLFAPWGFPAAKGEFNFSSRLQEAFMQILGLPLSVDVLRKMHIFHTIKSEALLHGDEALSGTLYKKLSKEMNTDVQTLLAWYHLIIPNDLEVPIMSINNEPIIRTGANPRQDDVREALRQTYKILWFQYKTKWNSLLSSTHIVKINGVEKQIKDVLAGHTLSAIKSSSQRIKKVLDAEN